jgi:hypothetical protein
MLFERLTPDTQAAVKAVFRWLRAKSNELKSSLSTTVERRQFLEILGELEDEGTIESVSARRVRGFLKSGSCPAPDGLDTEQTYQPDTEAKTDADKQFQFIVWGGALNADTLDYNPRTEGSVNLFCVSRSDMRGWFSGLDVATGQFKGTSFRLTPAQLRDVYALIREAGDVHSYTEFARELQSENREAGMMNTYNTGWEAPREDEEGELSDEEKDLARVLADSAAAAAASASARAPRSTSGLQPFFAPEGDRVLRSMLFSQPVVAAEPEAAPGAAATAAAASQRRRQDASEAGMFGNLDDLNNALLEWQVAEQDREREAKAASDRARQAQAEEPSEQDNGLLGVYAVPSSRSRPQAQGLSGAVRSTRRRRATSAEAKDEQEAKRTMTNMQRAMFLQDISDEQVRRDTIMGSRFDEILQRRPAGIRSLSDTSSVSTQFVVQLRRLLAEASADTNVKSALLLNRQDSTVTSYEDVAAVVSGHITPSSLTFRIDNAFTPLPATDTQIPFALFRLLVANVIEEDTMNALDTFVINGQLVPDAHSYFWEIQRQDVIRKRPLWTSNQRQWGLFLVEQVWLDGRLHDRYVVAAFSDPDSAQLADFVVRFDNTTGVLHVKSVLFTPEAESFASDREVVAAAISSFKTDQRFHSKAIRVDALTADQDFIKALADLGFRDVQDTSAPSNYTIFFRDVQDTSAPSNYTILEWKTRCGSSRVGAAAAGEQSATRSEQKRASAASARTSARMASDRARPSARGARAREQLFAPTQPAGEFKTLGTSARPSAQNESSRAMMAIAEQEPASQQRLQQQRLSFATQVGQEESESEGELDLSDEQIAVLLAQETISPELRSELEQMSLERLQQYR